MRATFFILVSILVTACGAPVHNGVESSNGGLDLPDNGNYSPEASREAFKVTLYPVVQNQCARCHGVNQHPMFALADLQQAFNNLTAAQLANLNDPANSYMVKKIAGGHNGFPQSLASEISTQIAAWAKLLADAGPAPLPSPGPSPLPLPSTNTFQKISQEILVPKCLSCHSGSKAEKGVRFDTYVATMKSVTAGSPNASRLYTQLTSGAMPPTGRLSEAELNSIRDWIQAGALNN